MSKFCLLIHASLTIINSNSLYYVTDVYTSNAYTVRNLQWNVINMIKPKTNSQWICGGDFNIIRDDLEKRGGNKFPNYMIKLFKL